MISDRWIHRVSSARQQNLFRPEDVPEAPTEWEKAAALDQIAAEVVFNRPLDTAFHYLIPDSLRGLLNPGQRVKAPFGRGDRGDCWLLRRCGTGSGK